MSAELSLPELTAAVSGSAAALRSITTLQPIEGEGGKIFPATYAGGKYATETRRVRSGDGQETTVDCVLLNSVQSEANHAELALLDAVERGRIQLPIIEVDFATANAEFLKDVANQTSLEVPHRLADAILRDSLLPDGTRFSKSVYADRWRRSTPWNATAVYELCPTALVFGMWGSPEKPGGLGAKFERAFISEMVAVDVLRIDERSGFRVDPLGASSKVLVVPTADGAFELAGAKPPKGAKKPSELNHGNIVFENSNGGVRCRYAEQTTVVSLGALRKLRFPANGRNDPRRDDLARTVLAAIALCAGVLASERGTSLRSRASLIPVAPRAWELIDKPGEPPVSYTISSQTATALLRDAYSAAAAGGLTWTQNRITLSPSTELVKLVRASQEVAATDDTE
jgi:CRISPR-associated protein Csb1